MKQGAGRSRGFTIVELLIVIVVIAILAAITIVAYRGMQQRARDSSLRASLSQSSRKLLMYKQEQAVYPNTLGEAGVVNAANVSYQYTTANGNAEYCLTATYEGATSMSVNQLGTVIAAPCSGHTGGTQYCPSDSYVAINGYFCDGAEGSTPSLATGLIKLAGTASEVPSGSPGTYVARQTQRDSFLGNSFAIVAGETYCLEGWAATTSSTVTHAIGLQISGSGMTTQWLSGGASTAPTSTWKKINGCITIPAGYTDARVWTQNNGTNGTTAAPAWYEAAIRLTKQ